MIEYVVTEKTRRVVGRGEVELVLIVENGGKRREAIVSGETYYAIELGEKVRLRALD